MQAGETPLPLQPREGEAAGASKSSSQGGQEKPGAAGGRPQLLLELGEEEPRAFAQTDKVRAGS